MSRPFDPILSPLDAQNLQETGLLSPVSSVSSGGAGTLRMHRRRLNRSSDEEHNDIPLDVPIHSHSASRAFQEIPQFFISREALVFVGFAGFKADSLWYDYSNYLANPGEELDPRFLPADFIDFILNRIDRENDAWGDNDSLWRYCLASQGMSDEFNAAIMDPAFTYLRRSDSCYFWLRDTVEMRFAALQEIQEASRLREEDLLQLSTQQGSSEARSSHTRSGSNARTNNNNNNNTSSSSHGHHRNRSSSNIQRSGIPGLQLRTSGNVDDLANASVPGCTVLFKGLGNGRMRGLFDRSGNLRNMGVIASSPPGDFSGGEKRFYFSPDPKVARYHAAFAKRRSPAGAVSILSLTVPNAVLEQMQSPELLHLNFPSNQWKEVVWRSRRGLRLPSHLDMANRATLIIGNIARLPSDAYEEMDSFNEITENCLLKADRTNPDVPSVQFVFHYNTGEDFLVEHSDRSIRVTPFHASDLIAWDAEYGTR